MPFNTDKAIAITRQLMKDKGFEVPERRFCPTHGYDKCKYPCTENPDECVNPNPDDLPLDEPVNTGFKLKLGGKNTRVLYNKTTDVENETIENNDVLEEESETVSSTDILKALKKTQEVREISTTGKTDSQLFKELMEEFILFAPAQHKRKTELRKAFKQLLVIMYKYQYRQGLDTEGSNYGVTKAFIMSHISPKQRQYIDLALHNAMELGIIKQSLIREKMYYSIGNRTAELIKQRLCEDFTI